ncbi:MAG: bifunctional 4-hydroxy-2-oxoglutarate aldolase/2-dehydro-3-deoxy-phosphogluconate aldolase [Halieaceae bacterium]
MSITEQLSAYRVLPVITAEDVDSTVQLSRALLSGGMRAVEITLRTDAALDAIRAVREELPDMAVAAGTVTNPGELQAAIDVGCDFHVSPGLTGQLLAAAREAGATLVPGVATPSEIMLGMDYGLDCFKLFPAVPVGGMALLKALSGPFPKLAFCPTGGLSPANFRDFLALPNVVCCGGSWMVAADLVQNKEWDEISRLAKEAMS